MRSTHPVWTGLPWLTGWSADEHLLGLGVMPKRDDVRRVILVHVTGRVRLEDQAHAEPNTDLFSVCVWPSGRWKAVEARTLRVSGTGVVGYSSSTLGMTVWRRPNREDNRRG
jgi:hypothetical protein